MYFHVLIASVGWKTNQLQSILIFLESIHKLLWMQLQWVLHVSSLFCVSDSSDVVFAPAPDA